MTRFCSAEAICWEELVGHASDTGRNHCDPAEESWRADIAGRAEARRRNEGLGSVGRELIPGNDEDPFPPDDRPTLDTYPLPSP